MSSLEQLRDIYCGRNTYDSTEEWVSNLDVIMSELCEDAGLDFTPAVACPCCREMGYETPSECSYCEDGGECPTCNPA